MASLEEEGEKDGERKRGKGMGWEGGREGGRRLRGRERERTEGGEEGDKMWTYTRGRLAVSVSCGFEGFACSNDITTSCGEDMQTAHTVPVVPGNSSVLTCTHGIYMLWSTVAFRNAFSCLNCRPSALSASRSHDLLSQHIAVILDGGQGSYECCYDCR